MFTFKAAEERFKAAFASFAEHQSVDPHLSDAELVRRALSAGTPEERKTILAAIAERYHALVLRQCTNWISDPEKAQDVFQATFETAFALLSQREGPRRPDKLPGWLIEIARRRAQEHFRRNERDVPWEGLSEGQGLD